VEFFKFEEKFGKTYVLPPSIFLRRGGFKLGETLKFRDHNGKEHVIEVGPKERGEEGEWTIYLNVDHHERVFLFQEEAAGEGAAKAPQFSTQEIADLAKLGDFRAPFAANVCEVSVEVGQEVAVGDRLIILEAMKMQTPINAEVAGKVATIHVDVGTAAKMGDRLVKIAIEE
jgi:pyruvate carboxylase